MTRLINCENFSANDDKNQNLVDDMRGPTFEVFNHSNQSNVQSYKSTRVRLPNVVAHQRSSRIGCCRKRAINARFAYWTLLARHVRATTKRDGK